MLSVHKDSLHQVNLTANMITFADTVLFKQRSALSWKQLHNSTSGLSLIVVTVTTVSFLPRLGPKDPLIFS